MKNQLLSIMVFSAMLLTSCSKMEEGVSDATSGGADSVTTDEVCFTSQIATRSSVTAFANGDNITVSSSDGQNATYSYGSSTSLFTAVSPIKFASDGNLAFYAAYPSTAASDVKSEFIFEAQSNQSRGLSSSDLLVAKTASSTSRTPDLQFDHAMAHIIIEVELGTDVSLDYRMKTQAAVDIEAGECEGTGGTTVITPYNSSGRVYEAIVAPQTLQSGDVASLLIVDGATLAWIPTADSPVVFESGKYYEYTWEFEKTVPTLTSTGYIADWEEGPDNEYYYNTPAIVPKTSWAAVYTSDDWSDSGTPTLGGDTQSNHTRPIYYLWDETYYENTYTFHSTDGAIAGGLSFTVDLGAEYYITRLFMSPRNYLSGVNNSIKAFEMYGAKEITQAMIDAETGGSPDFTAWTHLISEGEISQNTPIETLGYTVDADGNTIVDGSGEWIDVNTNLGTSVRYIRIQPTGTTWNGNATSYNISEIAVECLMLGLAE